MTASLLASFVMFVLTGVWTLNHTQFSSNTLVNSCLTVTILANSVFFYYFAALTEMDEAVQTRLDTASFWEWWIRVANQIILYSLWFMLQFSIEYFGWALIILYIGFIAWDLVTCKQVGDLCLTALDVFGALLALALLKIANALANVPADAKPDNTLFVLGAITALYILVAVVGLVYACCGKPRFRIWEKKYWTQKARR